MNRCLSLLLLLLFCSCADAQTVKQSGTVTPGHPAMWITNGAIKDAGPAVAGFLTGLGVTASGPSICANSGPTSGPYQQLCLSVNTGGPGQIIFQGFGGAPMEPLQVVINGTAYGLPFTGAGSNLVNGPSVSVVNDLACWNNLTGSLLSDCGTSGTTPTFAGLTVSGLSSGGISCVQANASGGLSITGNTCGNGGAGTVNSVANSDATLNISPTMGSVVASLNTAHANTWTAVQTFPNASLTAAELAAGSAATNVGALGGVLGGTLPNPTMASGAAATNVGTLGGVLTGTLPNPSIANNAVTNAMLATMAADTVKCNNTGGGANAADCTSVVLNVVTTNFLTSARTTSWFSNDSPAVNELRWGDKILVGDAATHYTDTNACPTGDWFTNFMATTSNNACAYIGAFSEVLEVKTNNTANNSGGMFAANTASFGSSVACPSCGSIGVMGFVLNNNTVVGHAGFSIYGECDITQNPGIGSAGCVGIEVDVGNFVGAGVPGDPSPNQQSALVGIQDACGSGISSPATFNCGSAMQIVPNTQPFTVGINFLVGSIAATSYGSAGTFPRAILMPAGYAISWWGSGTTEVGGINVDSSGNVNIVGTTLRFNGVPITVP